MFKCALLYGMTSEEFWFGDPQDYFVYQDAFAERQTIDHDEMDIRAWMFGRYNMLAFAQAYADAWGKKGKHKKIFPDKPLYLAQKDEEKGERDMLAKFRDIAASINQSLGDGAKRRKRKKKKNGRAD